VNNVVVEEYRDLPLVRVEIQVRRGAAEDAQADDGLTNFACELMARGAGGKTRAELEASFDALGTSLDVIADLDAVYFEITVLRDKLEPALALLAEVICAPDFPDTEAEKLRRELEAQLDELRDDDGQLARRFYQRAFWGAHPYGRSIVGTAKTIRKLRVPHAREWHKRALRRGDVTFGFAGDVGEKRAHELVAKHFARLPDGEAALSSALPDPPSRWGKRLVLVDKPDRTQSQILLGHAAPRWGGDDFFPLQVATCAFGGTFTARLMNEVRSKRGLSYGASARLGQGRGRRSLTMHVFPSLEQTCETLELVLRLYRELADGGLTADELEFARGYLANSFAFGIATPEDRLELRLALALCGLPADWARTFPSRIRTVTLAETRRALAAHARPNDLTVCIVSTASALLPRLEQAGLAKQFVIDVVPFDGY
jgi:zinc protease